MALIKEIKQPDGVTTTYHVVSYVASNTGANTILTVTSYIDEAAAREAMAGSHMPYRKSDTFTVPYDEGMTINRAYEYLLTISKYEGAESTIDFPDEVTGEELIGMIEEVM